MYCTKCGHEIRELDSFCRQCGSELAVATPRPLVKEATVQNNKGTYPSHNASVGPNTIKKPSKILKGLDGWLGFFQFRIYTGLVLNIIMVLANGFIDYAYMSALLYIPLVLSVLLLMYSPMIVCLVLFYKKRMAFRIWYIVSATIFLVVSILSLDFSLLGIILEIIIFIALFRSKRVKNTFTTRAQRQRAAYRTRQVV